MSAALGRVLAHERGARGAIRVLARSGEWGRRNFARWMFEDEPRAVALTPSRWHRRVLAPPRRLRRLTSPEPRFGPDHAPATSSPRATTIRTET